MAETLSQSEFARHIGLTTARITQLKQQGLIVMSEDGRVLVEETENRLAARPKNYRGGVTKSRPGSEDIVAASRSAPLPDESPAEAAERIVVREGEAPHEHAEAVRIKENYLARLRQLEFDQKSGAVVPIDTVIAGFVEVCGRLRNKLSNIPTRIAPRAAVLRSAEEVRALIEDEIALVLQELTLDGEGHVTLDDLRDTIRDRFGVIH